jgi:hypothetical protein
LMRAVADLQKRRAENVGTEFPDELVRDAWTGIQMQALKDGTVEALRGVEKISYVDGRDPKTPTTARQAAEDYSKYRAQRAAEVLQAIQAERDQAEQPTEAEPAPVEEPPQPTSEEQARQAVEQQQADLMAQAAAEIQNVQRQAADYSMALSALVQNLNARTAAEFGLQTAEDAQRLQQQDPEKFRQFQAATMDELRVRQELAAVHGHQQQIQAAQQQQWHAQFQKYGAAEGAKVSQYVPELRNDAPREVTREFQRAAVDCLKSVGFSEEEVRAAHGGAPVSLRDHRTQRIIAAATKYYQGQQRMREVSKRPVPKVQRPGTAGVVHAGAVSELRDAERRLRSTPTGNANIAAAMEYLNAKRAARGN